MIKLFIEEKIMVYLMLLKITPNLKGYKYIKAAVMKICEDESLKYQMANKLYKEIAPEFGEKPSLFDRALRHAVDVSFNREGIHQFERAAKVYFSMPRPSAREVICVLAEKLRIDVYNEFAV